MSLTTTSPTSTSSNPTVEFSYATTKKLDSPVDFPNVTAVQLYSPNLV